jgi:hypothetical protein
MYPSFVAVGDFYGRECLDLVVPDGSNFVTVLVGVGDGSFWEDGSFGAGVGTRSVAVADFNRDGNRTWPWPTTIPTTSQCC